jgi:hypothetical protein
VLPTLAVPSSAVEDVPLSAEAGVDSRLIAIGDTFSLHLDLQWQDGVEVKPLAIVDRIGNFVVRDLRRGLTTRQGDRLARRVSMLLTVFETGRQTIPEISVIYIGTDGTTGRVETAPIDIEVESILADGAVDIRDIKDPITVPRRWKDLILSYALLVGLAAGTAVSVLLSVKRKHEIETLLHRLWLKVIDPLRRLAVYLLTLLGLLKAGKQTPAYDVEVTEPHLVPEEAALKELQRIEALGLVKHGMTKDFYTLVSETVRRYLERKYGILAMESPTSFTLGVISEMDIPAQGNDLISEVLEEADLVKFAKSRPSDEAVNSLLDRARRIVRLTGSAVAVSGGLGEEPA